MAHVVGSVDLDAMVLAIPTFAELTGIQHDPSKRPGDTPSTKQSTT